MNPLTYETKRAHWKATYYGIELFNLCAMEWKKPLLHKMTPARFDVLYTAWMYRGHERCAAEELGHTPARKIPMSELRAILGLAASTVSQLCHRLEQLELVFVRRDDPRDKRCVSVTLTDDGIEVLALAIECISMRGFVRGRDGLPKLGIRRYIESFVEKRASDGLSREGTPEEFQQRVILRLCTIVDRARTYARYLGSKALALFDPRFVDPAPYPPLFEDDA